MIKVMYGFILVGLLAALVGVMMGSKDTVPVTPVPEVNVPVEVMCTADAMQCADGSYVGRTGPDCAFVCPATPVGVDKSDLIILDSPQPLSVIGSPLQISGKARGGWFFEASFPVTLTNWDGLIIAEGPATATGDWMTSEFVSFTATLNYVSPFKPGDPDFMKAGSLILQKDNPSGLPENDDALEIQVRFAP